MKDKVLIVEDEFDIANLIQVHLSELDIDSDICCHGQQGLEQALKQNYQLVMLDVMLPGINGLDICRQIRQEKPLQAILMLTSKTSETDRILGLELGADDYMTKPFSIREMQARVRTQLRRVHAFTQRNSAEETKQNSNNNRQEKSSTCIGKLLVDARYHQVTYKDTAINLTSTEFELLDYLCKNPDQVFSRSQLLDGVWGYNHSGYEHTVNSHINRLRNKLEENCADPQIIQTVWGVGYKLNSLVFTNK
ncbi:response regulator transcription factor [Colwellia sp. MSW7]|uniref:Response regulator transcription factor n=1 Tax=Colwellia maritima TaxID=2912588 RepID=A0ABS9WZ64_9GAMM|nr:response regulator transcription factor [Colwellia maritima]MCI2283216.1 response regulator transcription factor [Colwellia maritima]